MERRPHAAPRATDREPQLADRELAHRRAWLSKDRETAVAGREPRGGSLMAYHHVMMYHELGLRMRLGWHPNRRTAARRREKAFGVLHLETHRAVNAECVGPEGFEDAHVA